MVSSRRDFLHTTLGASLAIMAHGPRAAAQTPAAQRTQRRLIVDAQVHLWKANTPDRPWVPGAEAQLPEPFTIERLVPMMDEAGVDRVVIVPPTLEGPRLDYAQEAVRRYPGRFAVMARIDLDDPRTALRFPTWKEQPGVLGIRLNFIPEEAQWLTDGTADWFWPAAEKAGIPVMFLTRGQTALFGPIAERHPGLPLIVDHMGVQSSAMAAYGLPRLIAETEALARYPNVSVKLSASPLFSSEPYPFRDMFPYMQRLFEAFGPRRSYWGSDITSSFAKATYRERVTQFTEELPFLSEEDKDWVMGRALVERLGWR
jgi:predicted TIM-barrel fold metal-dependent hydrolase